MGPERAATLMSLLPSVGWADVATKADLHHLEGRLDQIEQRVERRFDVFEAEVRTTQRAFVTWLLASQAAVLSVVIGAAGAVIALS
jgi:hypothetical protein